MHPVILEFHFSLFSHAYNQRPFYGVHYLGTGEPVFQQGVHGAAAVLGMDTHRTLGLATTWIPVTGLSMSVSAFPFWLRMVST